MKKKKETSYKKKDYKYSSYREYVINQIEGVIDIKTSKKKKKKQRIKHNLDDSKILSEIYKEQLIHNATNAEKFFSKKIDEYGITNIDFQIPIYTKDRFYIVDFLVVDKNIVVELDGGYHNTKHQMAKDKKRTDDLRKMGYDVIRFKNNEIQKMDSFLRMISNSCN